MVNRAIFDDIAVHQRRGFENGIPATRPGIHHYLAEACQRSGGKHACHQSISFEKKAGRDMNNTLSWHVIGSAIH